MTSATSDTTHADFLASHRNPRGLWDVELVDGAESLATIDNVIFACPTGSHLFGTDDAESDFDMKGVFLAPLESMILQEAPETVRAGTSDTPDAPNRPGDFDAEFIELRKFVRDALAGQTYAVEMLHAPPDDALLSHPLFDEVRANRRRLISRQIKPFIGYCRTQAKKYGAKGERLQTIEDALEVFESVERGEKIDAIVDQLPLQSPHAELIEHQIRGQSEPATLVEIAGKKFELHARVKKAVDSLRKLRESYGRRARRARDGVDWKAVSHSYRIAWELRELLQTGAISFPLENADFLRRVKRGEIPYERVDAEIPKLIDDALSTETDLPEAPDVEFWESWLVDTYLQIFCPP